MKLILATALAVLLAFPVQANSTHYRLFIYFSTKDKPEPFVEPGWESRIAETMAQCQKRRKSISNYITANISEGVKFTVFCVEFHAHGFEEGLQAFRKRLGSAL